MLSPEPAPGNQPDWAALLAEALRNYLREVDDWRRVCTRHEQSAIVRESETGLEITRRFADREVNGRLLLAALARLPTEKRLAPKSLPFGGARGRLSSADESDDARRSFRWQGRTVAVRSGPDPADGALLRVTLFVPPPVSDLPVLPLRVIAEALRCHEYLVPTGDAALAIPPQFSGLTISAYLERAMPSNLYASQSI